MQDNSAQATMNLIRRIGFWSSAALATLNIVGLLVAIALVFVLPTWEWRGIDTYRALLGTVPDLGVVGMYWLSILNVPVYVIVVVAVHNFVRPERKIWTQMALAFAILYAALVSVPYVLQVTTVRQDALPGEAAALALFIDSNPSSVSLAMEMVGSAFISLSMLFLGLAFSLAGLEGVVRQVFLASGLLGILIFFGHALGITSLRDTVNLVESFLVPLSNVLLWLLFRQSKISLQ